MSATLRFCARCKAEIPPERVEGFPETRVCIECSREIGGEFHRSFTQENLGKKGSLKKNMGGVKVRLRRKVIVPLERTVAEAAAE